MEYNTVAAPRSTLLRSILLIDLRDTLEHPEMVPDTVLEQEEIRAFEHPEMVPDTVFE